MVFGGFGVLPLNCSVFLWFKLSIFKMPPWQSLKLSTTALEAAIHQHLCTYGSSEMPGPDAEADGHVEAHRGGVLFSACCHLLVNLLRQDKRHLHLDNRPRPKTKNTFKPLNNKVLKSKKSLLSRLESSLLHLRTTAESERNAPTATSGRQIYNR